MKRHLLTSAWASLATLSLVACSNMSPMAMGPRFSLVAEADGPVAPSGEVPSRPNLGGRSIVVDLTTFLGDVRRLLAVDTVIQSVRVSLQSRQTGETVERILDRAALDAGRLQIVFEGLVLGEFKLTIEARDADARLLKQASSQWLTVLADSPVRVDAGILAASTPQVAPASSSGGGLPAPTPTTGAQTGLEATVRLHDGLELAGYAPGAVRQVVAGLPSPLGLVVDRQGNIWCSYGGYGAYRLAKVSPSGQILTTLNLDFHIGLTVDADGAIWGANEQGAVRKLDANGNVALTLSQGGTGIIPSNDGHLWVTSYQHLRKYTRSGTLVSDLSLAFDQVVLDPTTGELWLGVNQAGRCFLRQYTPDGTTLQREIALSDEYEMVSGMTVDQSRNVWVRMSRSLKKYSPDGMLLKTVPVRSASGTEIGRFGMPVGPNEIWWSGDALFRTNTEGEVLGVYRPSGVSGKPVLAPDGTLWVEGKDQIVQLQP